MYSALRYLFKFTIDQQDIGVVGWHSTGSIVTARGIDDCFMMFCNWIGKGTDSQQIVLLNQ